MQLIVIMIVKQQDATTLATVVTSVAPVDDVAPSLCNVIMRVRNFASEFCSSGLRAVIVRDE